jgi:type III secretory pathway component EscV
MFLERYTRRNLRTSIHSKLANPEGKRVKALVISPHVKKSVEASLQQTLGRQYEVAWRRYRLDLELVPQDLWC